MSNRLYGPFQDFDIKAWHELGPEDRGLSFSDTSSALSFLRRFARDPFAMTTLRAVALRELGAVSPVRLNEHAVFKQLAPQLVAGWLYLVPRDRLRHGGGGGGPWVPPDEPPEDDPEEPVVPPEEPVITTHWITFQVVDDDTATPVAGVKLRLRLPDGTVGTYTTDADGTVHLPGLDPGACDLERVLDTEAFEVVHFG